jgi:hypothetical protein
MAYQKPVNTIIEKIAKECEDAGAGTWTITRIVKELSEEESRDQTKLRKKTLDILKTVDPKTANVFARFQKMNVRTSNQTISPFDRGNIIQSLLKETNVNRGIAETIGREVENRIKDLNVSYLNTALIREMVNAKLLEYGHEGVRNQYARVGLPVYEVRNRMHADQSLANSMRTEYNLLHVIPHQLGDAHLHSDVYIAALEHFATRPLSTSITLPPQSSFDELLMELVHTLHEHQNVFALPPNVYGINLSASACVKARNTKKAADAIARSLARVRSPTKNKGSVCLNTFVPEGFDDHAIDREQSAHILNALLEQRRVYEKGYEVCVAVDSKYRLKLLQGKNTENLSIVNSNLHHTIPLNGYLATHNVSGLFGINLEKAAHETKGNEKAFLDRVTELADIVKELGEHKNTALETNAGLTALGITVKELHHSVGLHGLLAASGRVTESESKRDTIDLCEKIVKRITRRLEERWEVNQLADAKGVKRFTEENEKYAQPTRPEDSTILVSSRYLQKNYYYRATAHTKSRAQELIEKNVPLISLT